MLNAVTNTNKPAFVISLDEPELLEANAPGRQLWGITASRDLPLAIDTDMPALRDIRAASARITPDETPGPIEFHDQLVFWTHRGAQRLTSRYHLSGDNARVTIIIDDLATADEAADSTPAAGTSGDPAPPGPTSTTLDLRTMAHELRTPIGAVIALADMIDQEPFGSLGDPRYREYARDIRDSAHLALNIVAAALERNEGEEAILFGGIQEIDLEALLHKARRALRLNARSAGLAIDIDMPRDVPHLVANPPGLNQILLNLIANAIKFTPPGGQITLAAAQTPSGGLEIFVTDNGIGMTEYETTVLVEPSNPPATPPASNGTGPDSGSDPATPPSPGRSRLPAGDTAATDKSPSEPEKPRHRGIGFTLVRRLATAMGASLTVSSQRGVGTRVTVTFPASNVVPQPPSRDAT